jgi:hypothetical protein
MPVYPFASFLLAGVILWAEKRKPSIVRILSYIVLALVALLLLLSGFAHFVDISELTKSFVTRQRTAYDIAVFARAFENPGWFDYILWLFLFSMFVLILHWMRTGNVKVHVFSTFMLFVSLQIFLEGFAYPVFKNSHSIQSFAKQISTTYNLKDEAYVVNNLRYYSNLYGLNFYLGNHFKNFEKELPSEGYLIIGEKNLPMIREKYAGQYNFIELANTECPYYNELNDEVLVCEIVKY